MLKEKERWRNDEDCFGKVFLSWHTCDVFLVTCSDGIRHWFKSTDCLKFFLLSNPENRENYFEKLKKIKFFVKKEFDKRIGWTILFHEEFIRCRIWKYSKCSTRSTQKTRRWKVISFFFENKDVEVSLQQN